MSHSHKFDKWDDEPRKSKAKKTKLRRRDNKRRNTDDDALMVQFDKWS